MQRHRGSISDRLHGAAGGIHGVEAPGLAQRKQYTLGDAVIHAHHGVTRSQARQHDAAQHLGRLAGVNGEQLQFVGDYVQGFFAGRTRLLLHASTSCQSNKGTRSSGAYPMRNSE